MREKSKNKKIVLGIKKKAFNSGAPAHEARAAEHHGQQNLVNYPSEKIWL